MLQKLKKKKKGMKLDILVPKAYQRKRTPRKRRTVGPYTQISSFSLGIDAKAKSFWGYKYTQRHNIGGFNFKEHDRAFKYSGRVYQKVKLLVSEETQPLNPSSSFLCFPSAPRLNAEVSGKQIMMSSHVAGGISVEGAPEECPCPASSESHPRAHRRSRKRKTELKEESSDSEVTILRHFHYRGQARMDRSRNNTSTSGEGKLDSTTFLHYFMHIWGAFPEEKVKSFTYFDPLWFNLYANEKNRPMVLNWIKEKGIFSKRYVLVPIVLWSHWSLLIFCHLGESLQSKSNTPSLLLLDSLHAIGPTRLEPLIRRLLLDLYDMDDRLESKEQLKKIRLLIPKVPQQKKGEECGYYVLYYIHLFLESAPENFDVSAGYPYFMRKDWFTIEGIDCFYKRLDSLRPHLSDGHGDDSASTDSSDCVELFGTSS